MSFGVFNWLKTYARLRETFLRSHPERRLIPEFSEDSEAPDKRERDPIISFTPEFKEKVDATKWGLALLIAIVLLSGDS